MKRIGIRILIIVVMILGFSSPLFSEGTISPYRQIIFEMCGAGWVASAIAEIQNYDDGWRAASTRGDIVDVAAANIFADIMAGGITKVFPKAAIIQFLNKLDQESLQYGTVFVNPIYAAPTGCSVVSSNIECDEPPSGKTLILYSWNFVIFTDTEETADGTGDFDSLTSGTYIVGFDGDELTTTYLTIP